MSADGSSQLESFWNTAVAGIFNFYDMYAWLAPALALWLVLLGLVVLFAFTFDDVPPELVHGFSGTFRWAWRRWKN